MRYLQNCGGCLDKGKKYGFEVKMLGLEACEIERAGCFWLLERTLK
jgi:hypothetical protein